MGTNKLEIKQSPVRLCSLFLLVAALAVGSVDSYRRLSQEEDEHRFLTDYLPGDEDEGIDDELEDALSLYSKLRDLPEGIVDRGFLSCSLQLVQLIIGWISEPSQDCCDYIIVGSWCRKAPVNPPYQPVGPPGVGVRPPNPTGVMPPNPTGVMPPNPTGVMPPNPTGVMPPNPTGVTPPNPTGVAPPRPPGVIPTYPTGGGGVPTYPPGGGQNPYQPGGNRQPYPGQPGGMGFSTYGRSMPESDTSSEDDDSESDD